MGVIKIILKIYHVFFNIILCHPYGIAMFYACKHIKEHTYVERHTHTYVDTHIQTHTHTNIHMYTDIYTGIHTQKSMNCFNNVLFARTNTPTFSYKCYKELN